MCIRDSGDTMTLLDIYLEASVSGVGGGLVGGLLAEGLCAVIGTVGAYIVVLVLFLISAVCITCLLYTSPVWNLLC